MSNCEAQDMSEWSTRMYMMDFLTASLSLLYVNLVGPNSLIISLSSTRMILTDFLQSQIFCNHHYFYLHISLSLSLVTKRMSTVKYGYHGNNFFFLDRQAVGCREC